MHCAAGTEASALFLQALAAGVPITSLWVNETECGTHDENGLPIDIPVPMQDEMQVVIDNYVPPPPLLVYTTDVPLDGRVRTLDATPTEVLRYPLQQLTGYTGTAVVIGVDAGNGAMRVLRFSFAVKRLNAGALAVGARVDIAMHGDAATNTWVIATSVNGNDAVVTVTGAASRTIDWSISGVMTTFTPQGFVG